MSTMLTINVTQDHIDKGDMSNCDTCPIALAIMDTGAALASVGSYTAEAAFFTPESEQVTFDLPPFARAWLGKFDQGTPVQPFTFTVTVTPID